MKKPARTPRKRATSRASTPAIAHVRHRHGGEFMVIRNDVRLAELTYDLSPETMAIDHTFVNPALRGNGIAQQLVDAAVTWARAHHRRIVPICPYVRAVFDKSPSKYRDVRA